MLFNNGRGEHLIESLKQSLQAPPIIAAWLFGSVARGTAREDSDIDIAVLFREGLSSSDRFDLRLELMNELSAVAERDVDVIDMEAAPLFLQHQVRKGGILIVESDRKRRIQFDVRSRQEYFDMKPAIDRRTTAFLTRCGRGGQTNG